MHEANGHKRITRRKRPWIFNEMKLLYQLNYPPRAFIFARDTEREREKIAGREEEENIVNFNLVTVLSIIFLCKRSNF
jgi:hypothetical protein